MNLINYFNYINKFNNSVLRTAKNSVYLSAKMTRCGIGNRMSPAQTYSVDIFVCVIVDVNVRPNWLRLWFSPMIEQWFNLSLVFVSLVVDVAVAISTDGGSVVPVLLTGGFLCFGFCLCCHDDFY